MRIVVGKPELPTPLIASMMHYIVFNPYWNVPDHLVRKVTAANVLKEGNAYLKRQGYQVMADWTVDSPVRSVDGCRLEGRCSRQGPHPRPPGPWPSQLDGQAQVSVPERAGHLPPRFCRNGNISRATSAISATDACGSTMHGGSAAGCSERPVAPSEQSRDPEQLPQGVPVYLTYITAQVRDGQITYLPDPYGWDSTPAQVASSAQ